ncbi:zinc finger and BTB domain-containing protein 17-like [Gigantopelta aegis]|uniref:zinc finger and BTB domain-containing protein 17-like n=1 Tax=Gigantopelta aegis TaxID=1735272 RepID=UPI001B88CA33|nr:zinc finger and BTB domain-containing protein 17-like [Gigantopelta aegis]
MAVEEKKAIAYTATGFCDNVLHTLYELQQSQKLCDVSLQAKDGFVFVHSLVFAACSTFFQQWLLQKPAHKKKKLIFEVPEVTLIQLKELTEFFYTGRLVLTPENIDAYLKLFKKLCIEEAVTLCNEFVSSQLKAATMDVKSSTESSQNGSVFVSGMREVDEENMHSVGGRLTTLIAAGKNNTSNENLITDMMRNDGAVNFDSVNHLEDNNGSVADVDQYTSISSKHKDVGMSVETEGSGNQDVADNSAVFDGTDRDGTNRDGSHRDGLSLGCVLPTGSKSSSSVSPVRRSERARRASAKYVALKEEKTKTAQRKCTRENSTGDKNLCSEQSLAGEEKEQILVEQGKKKSNKRKQKMEVAPDESIMSKSSLTKCKKLKFTISEDVKVKKEDEGKTTKKRKKKLTVRKIQRRMKKSTSETFECEFCNHFAVNFKALEMHKHSKHDIPYDPTRHTIYTCKVCGYETLMAARLDIHIASHSDDRPFVCETCGKSFKLSCELTMHAKVHINPSMLDCTHCGKTFSTVYNLKDHIEHQHFGRKKFLCHLCCHRAVNRLHLDRHLYKLHRVPLPAKCNLFSCEMCGFESFKRYRFTEHMKRHKGEKDFICVVCKKGFVSQPALARHMIWHGEKKFKCTYGDCQYATVQKKSLEEHTRLMHTGKDVKPYVCHLCPHRSGLKGNLDKHLRSVHKLDLVNKRRARYRYNPVSSGDEFERSLDITSDDFSMEGLSLVKKEPMSGEDTKPMKQAQFEAALNEAIARSMKYDGSSETESYLEDKSHKSQITQTVPDMEPDQSWQPNTGCSANSANSLDIQADSSGIADYGALQDDVASAEFTAESADEAAIIIHEMVPVQTDAATTTIGNIGLEEGTAGTQLTVICDSKSDAFSVLESVGFKFI